MLTLPASAASRGRKDPDAGAINAADAPLVRLLCRRVISAIAARRSRGAPDAGIITGVTPTRLPSGNGLASARPETGTDTTI